MTFTVSPTVARLVLPVAQKLLVIPVVQHQLAQRSSPPAAQPEKQGTQQHSYIWARAWNGQGHTGEACEAWLETGEGYDYSAAAAVRAVEQVLQHRPVGALTPAQAFGPDFPLAIPGVRRFAGGSR
jgi:hypothetical protein